MIALAALCLMQISCAVAASESMDHADHAGHGMAEDPLIAMLMVDRLEASRQNQLTAGAWDARAWIGTDHSRWQLRSEGHDAASGHSADTTLELSWLRPVSPWMQLAVGVVRDVQGGHSRNGVAAGLVGVLPYRVNLQSAVWLTDGPHAAVRIELEQDWLLTQRWVLQPRIETRLWSSGDRNADVGLRLRYEIRRELAPYVGVNQAFSRDAGITEAGGMQVVAGLRAWF
jgi:copper resistance protein B